MRAPRELNTQERFRARFAASFSKMVALLVVGVALFVVWVGFTENAYVFLFVLFGVMYLGWKIGGRLCTTIFGHWWDR